MSNAIILQAYDGIAEHVYYSGSNERIDIFNEQLLKAGLISLPREYEAVRGPDDLLQGNYPSEVEEPCQIHVLECLVEDIGIHLVRMQLIQFELFKIEVLSRGPCTLKAVFITK